MVKALATITRKAPMEVRESNVLGRAVQILADRRGGGPVETLPDLLALIRSAPDELRTVAVDRGELAIYYRLTASLEAALLAMMMPEGPVSDLFARPTTVPMRRDRPAVYDVSWIKDTESDLQAAALLACWSNGFAAVNYHHLLADAGLEPRRHYFIPLWVGIGVAVIGGGGLWVTVHLGAAIDGLPTPANNPIQLLGDLVKDRYPWPPSATWIGAALLALLLAVTATGGWWVLRRHGKRVRGDRAASLMGAGRDLEPISTRSVTATAARLGMTGSIGIPIADTVAGGATLWQGWEDVSVDIWGPRQGKTSSRVIPAILDAPGAVFVTSNKRDVVDSTRGVRDTAGTVWVFDPQNIVGEAASWWWDPLSYVRDEIDAGELASVFFKVSSGPDAKTDAYFTTAAVNLLLAAALGGQLLTQVYLWLTDPTSSEPAQILTEQGYPLNAAGVREIVNAPDKQRAGVYSTAQTVMSFCTNRAAMTWCTPDPNRRRPHFDPDQFARSTDTLYCVSKEGRGSTAGLVTALTVAVAAAAEKLGERSRGGRLPVPMVLVLDEAANVCRWPELPNLYSHFGSRGIAVLTILQSWAQGVEVWGRDGMTKLWGAATVKVVGSGVSGADFLQDLSALIGDYDAPQLSVSTGSRQSPGYSRSKQKERIRTSPTSPPSPKAVPSSSPPEPGPRCAEPRPWMTGPHAEHVRASVALYDPTAVPVAVLPAGTISDGD